MGFQPAAVLLIFAAVIASVIFLVLRPQKVKVGQFHVPISYCWAPLVGVVVMLATLCVSFEDVANGVRGDEHIQPYGILILFMSLAYIAASLDCTGVFVWLALHITRASKGKGHLLFFLYYLGSAIMTTFTSNDVSIMTLTPIIIYFARATKCDPMPYLTAEFMAANIWGMLLFIGNPTNIIVAQAFDLTFIGYSKYMALPTLVIGVLCIFQLYLSVRHRLPRHLELPDVHPSSMLTDRVGAVFGCLNMAVCLLLLVLAPSLHWDMWLITLVCALIHAAYNVVAMVALDPVTGQWVGLAALVGKRQEVQVPRTVVPYAASGPDEQAADDILAQDTATPMSAPPAKPAPRSSLFSRLHSSIFSTLHPARGAAGSTGVPEGRAAPYRRRSSPGTAMDASVAGHAGPPAPGGVRSHASVTVGAPVSRTHSPRWRPPQPSLSRRSSPISLSTSKATPAVTAPQPPSGSLSIPTDWQAAGAPPPYAALQELEAAGWVHNPLSQVLSDTARTQPAIASADQPPQPTTSQTSSKSSPQVAVTVEPPMHDAGRQESGQPLPCMPEDTCRSAGGGSQGSQAQSQGGSPSLMRQHSTASQAQRRQPPSPSLLRHASSREARSPHGVHWVGGAGAGPGDAAGAPEQALSTAVSSGPSALLLATNSMMHDVRQAWRREQHSQGEHSPRIANSHLPEQQQGAAGQGGSPAGSKGTLRMPSPKRSQLAGWLQQGSAESGRDWDVCSVASDSAARAAGSPRRAWHTSRISCELPVHRPASPTAGGPHHLQSHTRAQHAHHAIPPHILALGPIMVHAPGAHQDERARLLPGATNSSTPAGTHSCTASHADPAGVMVDVEPGPGECVSGDGRQGGSGRGSQGDGYEEGKSEGCGVEWENELAPPPRSFIRTLLCLPWEVVPFVLGMFILVEGLKVQGWVEKMAVGLGRACGMAGLGGTLLLMGGLSVALSNVINNQPMTIFLTTVCLQRDFLTAIGDGLGGVVVDGGTQQEDVPQAVSDIQQGALFAVVVGSNVGALFTLIGALAGIMWANVIRSMRITVTYTSFIRNMAPLGLSGMVVALLVLWGALVMF